ncbi:hypothetical protein OSSY52_17450 [Tepiditoga spiralis]|uniref:TIGR00153 family protein n=1 Tax=Tepiditoga spiralis TaxID=2108365 RepID=A0A7G1G8N5_9BACT|nr:TIGR00153 family protein [Tepiditoga spiralis]BBE31604.1 hypothetical protein OSSY52_17450 [Tepiditoga spiralis]
MDIWRKMFQKFNPINELIEHAKLVEKASDYLPELFKKYFNNEDISSLVKIIDNLEDDADDIKKNIRQNLKKGYMYRFERVEILEFVSLQDKIIDDIEDIAKMMELNYVEIDDKIKKDIFEIVDEVENMLDLFKRSVKYLLNILESDFSKRTVSVEKTDIQELKWYEKDIDNKIYPFGKWLYAQKNTMNAVDIFFLRNLILKLSQIADVSQNVSDRIQILINE